MDDVGGTIKNAILQKVKSGQTVLPWNLCHLLLPFTCLNRMKQLSLKTSIRHSPSPKHFLSTNLFDRSMTGRLQCRIFQDGDRPESFTLNGTKKLVTLLVVTRSPIKAIASVQRAGMVYRSWEWMVAIPHLWTVVSRNMFLRLNLIFNLVSDGNNVFFILLI